MAEEFTIAPIRRLLKKAGNLRISMEATEALRNLIGEYGAKIASLAIQNAMSNSRKTVLERDIKEAMQKLKDSEER
jgi:histone H3/H4